MNEPTLHEAMDACRPGSDDLHLPELKALADSLPADPVRQVVSLACSGSTHDWEPRFATFRFPRDSRNGFCRGSKLRSRRTVTFCRSAVLCRTAMFCRPVTPCRSLNFAAKKTMRAASSKIGAARGWHGWPALPPCCWSRSRRGHSGQGIRRSTGEQLLSQSSGWYSQLADTAAWVRLPPNEMLREYPIASALRTVAKGWIDATDLVGQNAVAYELAAPRDATPRCS